MAPVDHVIPNRYARAVCSQRSARTRHSCEGQQRTSVTSHRGHPVAVTARRTPRADTGSRYRRRRYGSVHISNDEGWLRESVHGNHRGIHRGIDPDQWNGFIATQADPWIASGHLFLCEACSTPTAGLERLYPALVAESDAYGRPVVLAVGDTHVFRVDKPLYRTVGSLVENFTRVEVFGHPDVHWDRVTVDPREQEVFSFHQELVPTNITRRP